MTATRIILGQTASDALAAVGQAFLIIGKGSYPECPGRMVIYCQEIPKDRADAACRVALGQSNEGKPKKP